MAINRPEPPTKRKSSAIELVECSSRVSPTLARLIRKSAEKEAGGASPTDALLAAAGIKPGELATLRKEVSLVSTQAEQWREQAAREHGQLQEAKAALIRRDKDELVLRDSLRKTTEALIGAEQQILDLKARIAELTTALESRDEELTHSLSLLGLEEGAAEAVATLRDRLERGKIRVSGDTMAEIEIMITSLNRSEMRALSNILARRDWRLRIVRWLLRVRTGS